MLDDRVRMGGFKINHGFISIISINLFNYLRVLNDEQEDKLKQTAKVM